VYLSRLCLEPSPFFEGIIAGIEPSFGSSSSERGASILVEAVYRAAAKVVTHTDAESFFPGISTGSW